MAITLDDIVKLSNQKKILILAGIVLLIFGAYYYFIYTSKKKDIDEFQSKLELLEINLKKKQAIAKNIDKFKEEVAGLNVELKKALIKLPSQKEIPSLLKNISKLGKESGLEFLTFRPKPEVPQGFYAEIPIDIKVLGSFFEVSTFFDKVRRLSRIVNATEVIMIKDQTSRRGGGVVNTTCVITTFRFIEGDKSGTE
ncbi:MAG: type 4a pilus biogenesis protein PilO [Thermodesulfobacteriota bacterium]|nr:type 4a pilus biogenesis protein PilO [Thermodesulfobacteriota bacterium]